MIRYSNGSKEIFLESENPKRGLGISIIALVSSLVSLMIYPYVAPLAVLSALFSTIALITGREGRGLAIAALFFVLVFVVLVL